MLLANNSSRRLPLLVILTVALGACASGPRVTKIQDVPDTADAPYQKILVISMFQSFDTRRYLEQEIVKALSGRGVDAVAMTSLKGTDTKVNRESVLEVGASTNYYVFSVELTEYREPQNVEFEHVLALETDLYSTAEQERVWAIVTDRQFKEDREHARDYSKFVDEANAIVNQLARDKLVAR